MAISVLDKVQIFDEPVADWAFPVQEGFNLVKGCAVNLPAAGEFSCFPSSGP